MRKFDYSKLAERTWDTDILNFVAKIHECKGRQDLFIRQKPVELDRLVEIAKIPIGKEVSESIPCRDENGNMITKKVKGCLKDFNWAHTLTLEEGCVVRFLMVGGDFKVNVLNKPPTNVPTLKEVLNYQIEHSKK